MVITRKNSSYNLKSLMYQSKLRLLTIVSSRTYANKSFKFIIERSNKTNKIKIAHWHIDIHY